MIPSLTCLVTSRSKNKKWRRISLQPFFFFFFFLIIYLKRRVCFGPVCECWLNWSRGAEVGEERERGNKYKTIELYTQIHPSIPKRSDPYSLYYFLTTTPLHCVTLRYTALLSAKIIKPTSSKLFYTNDFIERILQDPKDPEGRYANKTYPPPDRRPKRQVHKQKKNTEQKRNTELCNDTYTNKREIQNKEES